MIEVGNGHEGQQPPAAEGGFLSRLWWTIVAPKRMFAAVAQGAPLWQPAVGVALLSVIAAYIGIPLQRTMMELNPQGLDPEQLDQAAKFVWVNIAVSPIIILVVNIVIAGISYIAVSVQAENSSFKRYATLFFYASIVSVLGYIASTAMVVMRGVEQVNSLKDARMPFGPAAFVVDTDNTMLYAVMSSFDVFFLWYYVLIAAGSMAVFGLSRAAGILVVVPVWLIQVLLLLLASASGSA